jgi:ATP-dependent Clp protease adaptor protein ClpS
MTTISPTIEKKKQSTRQIKEPGKFKVIVCNDDVTTIEFVIAMLISIFKYDEKRAFDLTIAIHQKGSAVAGIYSFEIAEQKALDATNMARHNGFPLITKVEPE